MYTAAGTLERDSYVEKFAPLVRKIAHHLQSRLPASVQVDDLIQAGMMGLMDAANRFEDGMGAQFETYASQRIRGSMLDELRQNDWLPRGVRKTQRQIETAVARLENRLFRSASEVEVAAELGVGLTDYQAMLAEAHGGQMIYYEDMAAEGEAGDGYLDRQHQGLAETGILELCQGISAAIRRLTIQIAITGLAFSGHIFVVDHLTTVRFGQHRLIVR